jgi:hypothetical protein
MLPLNKGVKRSITYWHNAQSQGRSGTIPWPPLASNALKRRQQPFAGGGIYALCPMVINALESTPCSRSSRGKS